MPLFFFHFDAMSESTRDEVGCEFETLELAYLDAFRSAVEIGAEMLLGQSDPSIARIVITDRNGNALTTVNFDEIFMHRTIVPRRQDEALSPVLRAQLERSKRLGAEIREACISARTTIASARATLARPTAF